MSVPQAWGPPMLVYLSQVGVALGCTVVSGLQHFDVDFSVEATAPTPLAPVVEVLEVSRAAVSGTRASSSCGDIAGVRVLVGQPDDETIAEVGYLWGLPDDEGTAADPRLSAIQGGELVVRFTDDEPTEPMELSWSVTAVSRAGAMSEPILVEVAHPGVEVGCNVEAVGLGRGLHAVVVGLCASLIRRRR
jgi:hypothetical protein